MYRATVSERKNIDVCQNVNVTSLPSSPVTSFVFVHVRLRMCLFDFCYFSDDFGLILRTWTPILLIDWIMVNCVNCGIATDRSNATGSVPLHDEAVLSIIRARTGRQTVSIYSCTIIFLLVLIWGVIRSYKRALIGFDQSIDRII